MELCDRLSNVFGTEEYVSLRRQLVFLREKLENHNYIAEYVRIICSGSLGEGVAYPRSDDDLMVYRTYNRVVKSFRDAIRWGDLLMVPSESSPGYCLLIDADRSYRADMRHYINEIPFLSSILWKEKQLGEGEFIHGPCQSQIVGVYEYDHARCIPCSFWPDAAKNWIIRKRTYNWPSYEMIQHIVMEGCHVVPIGDQTSSLCQHEWRISFSAAERTLMHSFNHVQFLTYNLLRLCLKRVIGKRIPNVLCSYFMKTALFYTFENTPFHFWEGSNLETCFKSCLSVLYEYVEQRNCPNYFISGYNMLKRKVNNRNRHLLMDTIRHLYSIGIVRTMHLCGESEFFDWSPLDAVYEMGQDIGFIHSSFLSSTIHSLKDAICMFPTYRIESHPELLCNMLKFIEQNSIGKLGNFIFKIGTLFCCQKLMDLSFSQRINRTYYRVHKTIETLLKIGYNVDLTRVKLAAATYMYMIGKTESALFHIRRMLSEYPPYATDTTTCSDIQCETYMKFICNRGLTIDYKVRHTYGPAYQLHKCVLNAYPLPLRIWLSAWKRLSFDLDFLSYTYFLESLCFLRIKDTASLRRSERCLVNRLDDLITDIYIIKTKMCIGILKYAHNHSQSACRWFGSVYIMNDTMPPPIKEGFSKSVLTYMACLLNHRFHAEFLNVQNE